jgi:hypothetical protein
MIMGFQIGDQDALNSLNANRKADRIRLANLLQRLGEYYGATIERRDETATRGWCGQGIYLSFTLNGVGAQVSISNLHGGNHAIISWYNDYSGDVGRKCRNFTGAFNAAVGDLAHGRPHHKATSCPRDWFGLASRLSAGLSTALNGQAFRPVDEPAAT